MLNGYDITNMSNEEVNLIMQGINPEPYDPDKRIDVKNDKTTKHRTKIFTARSPEHLTNTINDFFDDNYGLIVIKNLYPYTYTDMQGVSKHCCFLYYIEL